MSETESELSDDELNSLLKDLESKAGGEGGGTPVDVDDDEASEDIDAYLASLEESEDPDAPASVKTKTADRERDAELDAKFAELDDMEPANLPAKTDADDSPSDTEAAEQSSDEKAVSKKGEKKQDDEESDAESSVSRKRKYGLAALKVFAISLPSMLFIWVLGAFLGNWVSAAWLIAAISVVVALGIPAVARHYLKKGKYMWWAIGLSLALVVAMVAPMPGQAGNALQKYGHWPASFVGELAGWDVDNAAVKATSVVSEQIGGLLPGAAVTLEGKQLGTEHDLDVPIVEQPEADTPEPTDDSTSPVE